MPRLRSELQQLHDELAILTEAAPKRPSLIALEERANKCPGSI